MRCLLRRGGGTDGPLCLVTREAQETSVADQAGQTG